MVFNTVEPQSIRTRLREGIVNFAFRKLDGTIRIAVGTTNLGLIPEQHRPIGLFTTSDASVRFYDIEKGAWRSFSSCQECLLVTPTAL